MTINLNSNIYFFRILLISILFSFFPPLRFSVFLSFATYFFVSFCLTLGVHFYVLCRSAISSEIVALSERCLTAPSNTVLPQCQS